MAFVGVSRRLQTNDRERLVRQRKSCNGQFSCPTELVTLAPAYPWRQRHTLVKWLDPLLRQVLNVPGKCSIDVI